MLTIVVTVAIVPDPTSTTTTITKTSMTTSTTTTEPSLNAITFTPRVATMRNTSTADTTTSSELVATTPIRSTKVAYKVANGNTPLNGDEDTTHKSVNGNEAQVSTKQVALGGVGVLAVAVLVGASFMAGAASARSKTTAAAPTDAADAADVEITGDVTTDAAANPDDVELGATDR